MAATVQQHASRKLDPYLELEFYLARAQKDIGDAFEHLELGEIGGCRKLTGLCKSSTVTDAVGCNSHKKVLPPSPLSSDAVHLLRVSRNECRTSSGRRSRALSRSIVPPIPPTRSDSFVVQTKLDRMPRSSSMPPNGVVVSDVDSLTTFVDALLKEVAAMTSEQDDQKPPAAPTVDATRVTSTSCESPNHKRNCDLEEFLRQVETSICSRSPLCAPREKRNEDEEEDQCDATTQTSPPMMASPVVSDRWNSDDGDNDTGDTYSDLDSETTSTSCDKLSRYIDRSNLPQPLNVAVTSESDADADVDTSVECRRRGCAGVRGPPLPLGPSSAPAAGSEWLDAAPPLAPCHWVSLWLDVNKSSSAPMLDSRGHQVVNVEGTSCSATLEHLSSSTTITNAHVHSSVMPSKNRSQSAKQLTELEAVEACKWLRAAGFPQYAQMFEDLQFPIDVSSVQKDHYFLDQDSIQSLFRRLNALNRCARMRLDNVPRKNSVRADDSDEENQCALSENWKFQRQSRRWSRIPGSFDAALLAAQKAREDLESSHISLTGIEATSSSAAVLRDEEDVRRHLATATATAIAIATASVNASVSAHSDATAATLEAGGASTAVGLRRTGSDRFKDGAKALLRKVESLKSRRSRRKNREAVVISGPQLLDVPGSDAQITPPDTPSQQLAGASASFGEVVVGGGGGGSSSSNSPSDASQHSTPQSMHGASDAHGSVQCFFGGGSGGGGSSSTTTTSTRRRGGDKDSFALSDSECSPTLWRSRPTSPTKVTRCYIQQYLTPDDSPRFFPDVTASTLFPYSQKVKHMDDGDDDDDDNDDDAGGINYRTGSFHLSRNESSSSAAYRGGRFPKTSATKTRVRGSIDGGGDGQQQQQQQQPLHDDRRSLYDNVPVVIFNKGYTDEHGEPLQASMIFNNITNLNLAFGATRTPSSCEQKSGFEECASTTTTTTSTTTTTTMTVSSSEEADSGSIASSTVMLQSGPTTSSERRDSGFGLSISRSNSRESAVQQQQQQQVPQPRWQMSNQCHRPSIPCRSLPLNGLSTGQMIVLRKLALLKLTALMERYCPSNRTGWNWAMPKFIKRMKMPDYKDKAVFGVPLTVILQRTGQPIPLPIQAAIRHLRKNAMDSLGLFRKSGVRSRIQRLKNLCEASGSTECASASSDLSRMTSMYEEHQPYDVADMVKQYFRELPEALLTNKMSGTFISVYQYVGEDVRLEALQAALILMPDENREVLQALLSFLSDVSCRAEENQMTASNLAVCFAPSLFHMNSPRRSHSTSPRRRKTVGAPDQRELNETRAAHECLAHMIREFHRIFSIPEDILVQCRCPELDLGEAPNVEDLFQTRVMSDGGSTTTTASYRSNWHVMVEAGIQWIFKESRERFKGGWVSATSGTPMTATSASAATGTLVDGTEVSFRKLGDGNPLRIWKVSVDVEAPPVELLNRVLRERHLWDADLLKWRVIDRLDKQTEIFQYVTNSMMPLPPRDFCVLRSWRTDFPKGMCVLFEMSVEHPDAMPLVNGVRANVLSSTYLIEPCGSGKSRVTHVSRVDIRGRSPDWYNKVYGSLCSLFVSQLRDSLQHVADGPESKV